MCLAGVITSEMKRSRQTKLIRTVAVGQVGSARRRRERAEGKGATRGTRRDSEAAHAGKCANKRKAQSSTGVVGGRVSGRAPKANTLTQGDLRGESPAEVSRGHSSVDAGRKTGGAKDRRTKEIMLKENLIETLRQGLETTGRHNCGDEPGSTKGRRSGSSRSERLESAPTAGRVRNSPQKA